MPSIAGTDGISEADSSDKRGCDFPQTKELSLGLTCLETSSLSSLPVGDEPVTAVKWVPITYQQTENMIHIRHFGMHYCQCEYQNISQNQVADHQSTTKRKVYTWEDCMVLMVEGSQLPAFLKHEEAGR